jgi:DNA polymerase III delta subunit
MIYLLHGGDLVESRKRLSVLRHGYLDSDVRVLEGKSLDYSAFPLLFSTVSLFEGKSLVVVEGKIDVKLFDLARISKSDVDLVVWVGEKVRANDSLLTVVGKIGGKVELFEEKVDDRIFPFLDAIVSRNRKVALRELSSLFRDGRDPIYITTMLVWQFRNILAPELTSGFVRKKVDMVKKNFSFDELRKIYYLLLTSDVQLKTGEGVGEALIEEFVWKVTK